MLVREVTPYVQRWCNHWSFSPTFLPNKKIVLCLSATFSPIHYLWCPITTPFSNPTAFEGVMSWFQAFEPIPPLKGIEQNCSWRTTLLSANEESISSSPHFARLTVASNVEVIGKVATLIARTHCRSHFQKDQHRYAPRSTRLFDFSCHN